MKNKINISQLIVAIEKKLQTHFKDKTLCTQYAWWLVQAIAGKTEIELISANDIHWSTEHEQHLDQALDALINKHIPLQYLLGSTPFAGLDIIVRPPILIPRPETEEWICNLIDQLHPFKQEQLWILDLCTGSGCIALALADALPKAKVYATDINDAALELARENARHNQISNVTFLRSDLFNEISSAFKFDIIVSNPPYIDPRSWNTLEPSVRDWEDKNALIAEDHGLALVKRIIDQAPDYIKSNDHLKNSRIPQLSMEIDATQGQAVSTYMKEHAYNQIEIIKDLEGKDRIASGRVDYVAPTAHSL